MMTTLIALELSANDVVEVLGALLDRAQHVRGAAQDVMRRLIARSYRSRRLMLGQRGSL